LRDALRELGYAEGRNLVLDFRSAEGQDDRLPALASELLAAHVEVLVTAGSTSTQAAANATATVPIVQVTGGGSLLQRGLIASLARPGGNVTGLDPIAPDLDAKRLELLTQTVPSVSCIAVLMGPLGERANTMSRLEEPAQLLGLTLRAEVVREPGTLREAIETARRDGADALFVLGDPFTVSYVEAITESAARSGLPAAYADGRAVEVGGLMYYGPNVEDSYRRAAAYVDKLLKGAAPAELPVERPMKFDFVINLQTAQALGLTIPPHMLLQATEVIQ
jgi:putative ABC transport system substrate-binding protein